MDVGIRAEFYALLAQAFSSPDKGWVALKTRATRSIFKSIKKLYPLSPFYSAVEAFEKELNGLGKKADLSDLILEYNRLFVGPYKMAVPPYESLYRDSEGLVMSSCAVNVEKLYRENGLELSPEFKDLPDHISAELHFMAYLCLKEAEAEKGRNDQEFLKFISQQDAFLREHLGLWIDDFTRKLESSSSSPFYSSLGKLLSLFIKLDRDMVLLKMKLGFDSSV